MYDNMDDGKTKTLRYIEGEGFDYGGREVFTQFIKFLYEKFEEIHEKHVKMIEFIFITNMYYLMVMGVLTLFPPRQKYKIKYKCIGSFNDDLL